MINNIRKRDGRIENFDKEKIASAILKAMNHSFVNDIKCANSIADKIENLDVDVIDIEEVQNLVEGELMKSQYKNVAKDYILYREKRNIASIRLRIIGTHKAEQCGFSRAISPYNSNRFTFFYFERNIT